MIMGNGSAANAAGPKETVFAANPVSTPDKSISTPTVLHRLICQRIR